MFIREEKSDWIVIVNPNAGKRKGEKDWTEISNLLKKHNLSFHSVFTQYSGHAVEITKKSIRNGYRKIIVVGGDGTMNEVVNGVFLQKYCPSFQIVLAMITVGTGNDWGKMFGIPMEYEKSIKIICNYNVIHQDAGVVYFYQGIERSKRYFINIAGLGFDAVVVKRTNFQKQKGRSGKILYMLNLLRSLISYKSTSVEVDIDGFRIKNQVFTISIGIGKYSGGGMMQTPEAIADDGLFDITVLKKIKKGNLILSLKKLYNGTILEHPNIENFRGKIIKIDSDPLIHLETDGESLGHSPIEFRILTKSIGVVTAYT